MPPTALKIQDSRRFAQSALLVAFLAYGVFATSPVLPYFGWRGIFTLIIIFAFTVLFVASRAERIKTGYLMLMGMVLATSMVTGLYWNDMRYVLAQVFFLMALWLVQFADNRLVERFVGAATVILFLMIGGAFIGFALAQAGVEPLFALTNPDGRPSWFYFTTLTNHRLGSFIRPSGLFDEPGAFSFLICVTAAMRHLLKRDTRVTWLLLISGLITFSLAHLAYVVVHFLAERFNGRNLLRIVGVLAILVGAATAMGVHDIFGDHLLARTAIADTGQFVGDNRSWRLLNAYDHLKKYPQSVLFGADPSCRFDYDHCKRVFPLMGENPLAPLVLFGLLLSWPYYLVVFSMLSAPFLGRRYLVVFGVGLLFLQRPYILSIGYSLLALLVVWQMRYVFRARTVARRRWTFTSRLSTT